MLYRISLGSPIPSDGNFKLTSRMPLEGEGPRNIPVFDYGLDCRIKIERVHQHLRMALASMTYVAGAGGADC